MTADADLVMKRFYSIYYIVSIFSVNHKVGLCAANKAGGTIEGAWRRC